MIIVKYGKYILVIIHQNHKCEKWPWSVQKTSKIVTIKAVSSSLRYYVHQIRKTEVHTKSSRYTVPGIQKFGRPTSTCHKNACNSKDRRNKLKETPCQPEEEDASLPELQYLQQSALRRFGRARRPPDRQIYQ